MSHIATQPNPTHATPVPRGNAEPSPALAVQKLTVHRGDHRALHNVSFQVCAGEFLAIIGRSGAGKTSLVHTLAGLVAPSSGSVCWDAVAAGDDRGSDGNGSRPQRERLQPAVLFQHYRLVPQLSALTNVLGGRLGEYPWWRTLWGFPASETNRACEMLHSLGVSEGRCKLAARRLSGGEQQRVAVARALIQQPSVLLADEPVASLDAETANEIMQIFSDLNRKQKLTVICVLHDLEMAERYAPRALLLDRGQLVYDGPSRHLQSVVRERLQWKTLL